MVIDFRKLNKATKKDHYPLPFIDQMLEILSKHTHFFFLDGYSGFSQIPMSAKGLPGRKRGNVGSWNSGLKKEQLLETYSAQLQKS